MPTFRNSLYSCVNCGHVTEVMVEIPEGVEARYENYPPTHECEVCGGTAGKIMGAPAIMKAAYPDGTFRGEAFQLTKEIAKLKLKRKYAKKNEREEISKEIGSLQQTITKKNYTSK